MPVNLKKSKHFREFSDLPGRLLLDTNVLNVVYDEGAFIFDNVQPVNNLCCSQLTELEALRCIFAVNQRAKFQLVVSPVTVLEILNEQNIQSIQAKLFWTYDMLNHWLVMLDQINDRAVEGGSYRHRFKLNQNLQAIEEQLMKISSLRRDPLDRLLMLHYKMGNCDAFVTLDRKTIWRHRKQLNDLGITVILPSEYWEMLKPWAGIWL